MDKIRYFDAHSHLQNYRGPGKTGGAALTLVNGTAPDDWGDVLALSAADAGVVPCFGLHPWFIDKAGPLWLEELESCLKRAPSCVGEIGLDATKNTDAGRQEEFLKAQLELARKLNRPACLHCVKAWGRMLKIIKKEPPAAFLLHSYVGPAEMINEFAALGAYFSFGAAITDPKRKKLQQALSTVPPERLLFETERSGPALSSDPQELPELISTAAAVMGKPPNELAELSWNNGVRFLGDIAAAHN